MGAGCPSAALVANNARKGDDIQTGYRPGLDGHLACYQRGASPFYRCKRFDGDARQLVLVGGRTHPLIGIEVVLSTRPPSQSPNVLWIPVGGVLSSGMGGPDLRLGIVDRNGLR